MNDLAQRSGFIATQRGSLGAILGAAILGAAASLLLAGCSAPSLPSLPDITAALSPEPVVGPPTDIYARIARGAMSCWFGQSGPLRAGYVYHAEADPPSKGGKAQIVIHERDPTSTNPRGLRAYRILITPNGEASALAIENLTMPAPLVHGMERDVHRWAAGGIGCTGTDDGGWSASPPVPPQKPDAQPDAPKQPAKRGRSA